MSVRFAHKWVEVLTKLTVKERLEWVKVTLETLFTRKDKKSKDLAKMLTNKSKFKLIGFAPNISYVMVDNKDKSLLNSTFVHAFGSPKLVYLDKKHNVFLIVGGDIEHNTSTVSKNTKNAAIPVEGITG